VTRSLDRLESLFAAVLPKSPADRLAYLEQACADAPTLRERVEALLRAQQAAGSFLQSPAPGLAASALERPNAEGPGTVIGPYRLLEQIGEGGMGRVFAAEQRHPLRRWVALKVIKPGMDTRQVIARFDAERQALALMDHPNIARVLDAGTTAAGQPFFVMELVPGLPITCYCDEHQLTPRQRLQLFVPVCQAVQHAHQKGIIHRDLKPSNVLITHNDGRPVPKVIDFGVAKATSRKLTEDTLTTEFGAIVGTLEYMSPEQAELNQLDVDTRSDIYSLGVLLYELLTGTTPLQKERAKKGTLIDVLRLIREEEPPRPSTRLSTTQELPRIAASRGLEPQELSGLVRGELDWIVMKCLEKDRDRRYETAGDLPRDIERYLADEPVQACPPSAGYRLRKLGRKHRKSLGTLAVFMLLLLVGGAVTARQAIQLAQAEREGCLRVASQTREQAKRNQNLFFALSRARELHEQARSTPGRWDQWAEAMAYARRAEALLGEGLAEPELAWEVKSLLRELAEEQADRGLVARLEEIQLAQAEVDARDTRFRSEKALPEYRRALQDYGLRPAGQTPQEAAAFVQGLPGAIRGAVAAALEEWLDLARAEQLSEAAWLEQVLSAADRDGWRQRMRDARATKDLPRLERLAREVDVAMQPPYALFLLNRALDACGSREESVALLRRVQEAYPGDFWANYNLGTALANRQPPRLDEAIRFLTVAVALRPENPGARLRLSLSLSKRGRLAEAIAACRKAVELDPDYVLAHHHLGTLFCMVGRFDLAFAAHREAERAERRER
jgi:serine/threonine protein kinase/tetratricopeptide (TPR) repeat protein